MMSTQNVIKKIRINLELDQTEFAKELGVSKSTICKYEKGERTPRFRIARKIKELAEGKSLNVSIEDIISKD